MKPQKPQRGYNRLKIKWDDPEQRNAYHTEKMRLYRAMSNDPVYPLIFGVLIGRAWRTLAQNFLK
jgi:hypothetical protein